MGTTTTNYSLNKPTVGGDDDAWGGLINTSMDTIDTQMKANADAAAAAVQDSDIGVTVQAYDADTAKTDVAQTFTADQSHGDNVKAKFGASDDLQIYHDPAKGSIIKDTGAGHLFLQGSTGVQIEDTSGTDMLIANEGGEVSLHYSGSKKLATTSTGVDVTGTVTADGASITGQTDIESGAALGSGLNVNRSGHPSYGVVTGGVTDIYHAMKPSGGSWQTYMKVGATTGDISFYEDTGTTAKFFWDASAESLGIGTSSPATRLQVTKGPLVADYILRASDTYVSIDANSGGTAAAPALIVGGDSDTGWFRPGMNIIGLTTGGTERARIDSSGNLLVGTTSTYPGLANTVSGVSISSNALWASRSGNVVGSFNRNTNDGDIVQFRQGGTTVGSIGTASGTSYIYGAASGLIFNSNRIGSCNASGAILDNITDLGNTNNRFKSLYLSGGVYLGGTGAANKLDDYETGTWTPDFDNVAYSSLTHYARYTKIGNVVHIHAKLNLTGTLTSDTSVISISGLPFTIADSGDSQQRSIFTIGGDTLGLGANAYRAHFRSSGNAELNGIHINATNGGTEYWRYSNLSSNVIELNISGTYYTNS